MSETTELCELFAKYGADKCPKILHSYSPAYFEILNPIKNEVKNLFEIGVGNKPLMDSIVGENYIPGASLRAWSDFFSNANIFGCDIMRSVLFNDDRIRTYFMDQSNPYSIIECITTIRQDLQQNIFFDVIIDDGSHNKNHMMLSFSILKDQLAPNGLYIIEDIISSDLEEFTRLGDDSTSKLEYVHKGNGGQDSFVVYKNIKK